MLYVKSCEYNIDSGFLESEDVFGNKYAVDVGVVENEFADNMYDRSALDYLLYNRPVEYLIFLLSGELRGVFGCRGNTLGTIAVRLLFLNRAGADGVEERGIFFLI